MTKRTQRTRTDFLCLTISAGEGRTPCQTSVNVLPHFDYTVQIKSDATGAAISFRYHDSAHRHGQGVDQLDRENLLYALQSFVSDAEIGALSFAEYCDEFGANVDSISERRTWEACRSASRKFARLFHDDREPGFVLNLLAAEGVE